jgi:hypothetical protein
MNLTYTSIIFFAATVLVAQDSPGFIHGTVTDIHGYVIPEARVEVSSPDHECRTASNAEGRFNCELPPGVYDIIATGRSFLQYRRASVTLQAKAHVFLKLRTVPAPLAIFSVPPATQAPSGPKIDYRTQKVGSADVLVRYGSLTENGGQITFRGPYLMLTMDTLAVYADELSCSDPIRTCTAKGSVIAELGQEQLDGAALDLDLSSRKLVLTRDANVVRTF